MGILEKVSFVFTLKSLNAKSDVLMSFNAEPYHRSLQPPVRFHGLKVWHVMDYVFKPQDTAKHLQRAGVNFVMGYARHDVYCDFFKKYYDSFLGKVLAVPFGFGERFKFTTPFTQRESRCAALGAVNPVNDPLCPPDTLHEYIDFYRHKEWTHEFRRTLSVNASSISTHVHSLLPLFPVTKNPDYDPVEVLNQYQLFVNDEGLMNFPPARTYEGIACGAIMVASKSQIYEDLGFRDGINYIAFEKNNLEDFLNKLKVYQNSTDKLLEIHQNALELSKKFTHEKVAERLHEQVKGLVK